MVLTYPSSCRRPCPAQPVSDGAYYLACGLVVSIEEYHATK